jgi:RNA polymerase sigma factor (TIGR02999 family)
MGAGGQSCGTFNLSHKSTRYWRRCDISGTRDLTRILDRIHEGDPAAAQHLLPLVYDELRQLAAQKLSQEKPGQTLQATALVHEAYMRVVGTDDKDQQWDSRRHFFAAAAEAMRRILIENARRKGRLKRGGGLQRVELDPAHLTVGSPGEDLLAVDEALERLAHDDAQAALLVKLRYFTGLSIEEAAEMAGLSRSTAYEHWAYARAWLHRHLKDAADPSKP